jgi:hypothetical protein
MKQTIIGAVCAAVLVAASGAAQAASISGQGTWESTLQGRDLDGNPATVEAYYDTSLNITWLANPNLSGPPMTQSAAMAWAAGLNPYGSGSTGWVLPSDTSLCTGGGCTVSQLGSLYYNTLGNSAGALTNSGPFQFDFSLSNYFWTSASNTTLVPSKSGGSSLITYQYSFDFVNGQLQKFSGSTTATAWAVHAGDVGVAATSAVPVPASVWLLASGLLGLGGVARRRVL